MDKKERLVPKGIWLPFVLITSLFFLWGLANNMTDTLLAAFKRIMSMSDSRTALIQISCYGLGYFIFALPAAIYIKRFSYKSGVLLGLGLYLIGCFLFFPAKYTANYYHWGIVDSFRRFINPGDSSQSLHHSHGTSFDGNTAPEFCPIV